MKVLVVERHGFATKQVVDLYIAYPAHRHPSVRDLIQTGNDLHLDRDRAADIQYAADLNASRIIERDDYLLDIQLVDEPGNIVSRAEDFVAADTAAFLSRVVVDQSAYLELRIAPPAQLFYQCRSHSPGADQQRRLLLCPMLAGEDLVLFTELVEDPSKHAQAEKTAEGEDAIYQDHRDRYLPKIKVRKHQQETKRYQDPAGYQCRLEKKL